MTKKIRTRTEESWIDENDIMIHMSLPGAVHNIAEAKENVSAAKEILKDRRLPTLTDLTHCKKVSSEAREYYSADENTRNVQILAMVIANPVAKVIGSFFLKLNSPGYQVRLFNNHDKAYRWLLENK